MNAAQYNTTPSHSIQQKLGLLSCAVLAFALIGTIVHDLGASPAHAAAHSVAVRAAA